MFVSLIWGPTMRRTPAGIAADFCPSCRAIRHHDVDAVHATTQLLQIPLAKGTHVGYEATCETCGFRHEVARDTYQRIVREAPDDVDALVAETQPDVRTRHARALDRADRLASLAPEEREAEIHGACGQLERRLLDRLVNARMTGAGRAAAAITLACLLALIGLVHREGAPPAWEADPYVMILFWVVVVGAALSFVLMHPVVDGYGLPDPAARLLGPIRPSRDEVEAVYARLREERRALPERVSAAKLHGWSLAAPR